MQLTATEKNSTHNYMVHGENMIYNVMTRTECDLIQVCEV